MPNVTNSIGCTFGIEANSRRIEDFRSNDEDAPRDWDVFVRQENAEELTEVKSGAVSKADRIVFWRRLRREIAQPRQTTFRLLPSLVVDPQRAGNLEIWQGLAETAATWTDMLPLHDPSRVDSPKSLTEEALWWLCCTAGGEGTPATACSMEAALNLLVDFKLRMWPEGELDAAVAKFLFVLFSDGITDVIRRQVMGWINERATDPDPGSHYFTVRELISEVGLLKHSLSAQPGQITRWRNLWRELPLIIRERVRMKSGTPFYTKMGASGLHSTNGDPSGLPNGTSRLSGIFCTVPVSIGWSPKPSCNSLERRFFSISFGAHL